MKLVNHNVEILEQSSGLKGIYKQIELAGRTCYKSEDKITEDSAKGFVDRMIKSGHGAMLEHGTVYLYIQYSSPVEDFNYIDAFNIHHRYSSNKYSKVNSIIENSYKTHVYITSNLRVLVENNWLEDLKYICEPTKYHEKRITVRFITGIDITREFNRHRVNSMAEQSTRYCNFTKNKFGKELSIIKPTEIDSARINNAELSFYLNNCHDPFKSMCESISNGKDSKFSDLDIWLFANSASEWSYFKLIDLGWKPQFARRVLCLDTQSELIHTAFISDWKHFFELRCDKAAHPDAQYLANILKNKFIEMKLL